jgi:small-conductance mechanosensitive channel
VESEGPFVANVTVRILRVASGCGLSPRSCPFDAGRHGDKTRSSIKPGSETMDLTSLVEWTFYGNDLLAWTIAGVVAAVAYLLLVVLKRIAIGQLRALGSRLESDFPPIALETLRATRHWLLILVGVRAGSLTLALPARLDDLLTLIVVVGVVFQLAIWGNRASKAWLTRYSERKLDEDAASVTTMRVVVFMARVLAWAIVLLVALDNLGVDITALIAGLGIGGIAVALAVQNILGDLFASLSIVVDKPFVVGDFIIVDEFLGTVAYIGLKTTRVTSLSGEQLVFSNNDLLNSRIRNFKRMSERRVVFSFGVIYQTPLEKIEAIPGIVRQIIDDKDLARFDRAHFKEFGGSSLTFEVVYHVLVPDFNSYMDVQQAINIELYRRLLEMDVELAYPTQTLYVNEPGRTADHEPHPVAASP